MALEQEVRYEWSKLIKQPPFFQWNKIVGGVAFVVADTISSEGGAIFAGHTYPISYRGTPKNSIFVERYHRYAGKVASIWRRDDLFPPKMYSSIIFMQVLSTINNYSLVNKNKKINLATAYIHSIETSHNIERDSMSLDIQFIILQFLGENSKFLFVIRKLRTDNHCVLKFYFDLVWIDFDTGNTLKIERLSTPNGQTEFNLWGNHAPIAITRLNYALFAFISHHAFNLFFLDINLKESDNISAVLAYMESKPQMTPWMGRKQKFLSSINLIDLTEHENGASMAIQLVSYHGRNELFWKANVTVEYIAASLNVGKIAQNSVKSKKYGAFKESDICCCDPQNRYVLQCCNPNDFSVRNYNGEFRTLSIYRLKNGTAKACLGTLKFRQVEETKGKHCMFNPISVACDAANGVWMVLGDPGNCFDNPTYFVQFQYTLNLL